MIPTLIVAAVLSVTPGGRSGLIPGTTYWATCGQLADSQTVVHVADYTWWSTAAKRAVQEASLNSANYGVEPPLVVVVKPMYDKTWVVEYIVAETEEPCQLLAVTTKDQ